LPSVPSQQRVETPSIRNSKLRMTAAVIFVPATNGAVAPTWTKALMLSQ
jgi:hypothetical protein